jgi:hypothetical protein
MPMSTDPALPTGTLEGGGGGDWAGGEVGNTDWAGGDVGNTDCAVGEAGNSAGKRRDIVGSSAANRDIVSSLSDSAVEAVDLVDPDLGDELGKAVAMRGGGSVSIGSRNDIVSI